MNTIKRILLITCAASWIVGVTGFIFLLTDAYSYGLSVGLFTGGFVVSAAAITSSLTVTKGGERLGKWLKTRRWAFVSWKGNVLKIDVILFGVTISTTRIIYSYPITVVQKGESDFYVNT